jgi:hypothetical protein
MESIINETIQYIFFASKCTCDLSPCINIGLEKLQKLLTDPNYHICDDISESGNNPLHIIASNGLYEFYTEIKKHEDFPVLCDMINANGMTPLDIAMIKPCAINFILALSCNEPYILKNLIYSFGYHFLSQDKLLTEMIVDGLKSTCSLKDNVIKYVTQFGVPRHKNFGFDIGEYETDTQNLSQCRIEVLENLKICTDNTPIDSMIDILLEKSYKSPNAINIITYYGLYKKNE